MDRHLHNWQERFGADGLQVIEIDDGGSDSIEGVREWAAAAKISYPVYYDTGGRLTSSYGIDGFPTFLLVGRDGKISFEDYGWSEQGVGRLESEIHKALKQPGS